MVQCVSREADLHERQVVHVTEDYGDRLRVEGLQRPRNPAQSVCQCPWGLKVPCHNMWCCQTLPISLLLFKCLFSYDTFTSVQLQAMQILIRSCIDLPTLSCMDSSTYSKDCMHSFMHPVLYPFIHPSIQTFTASFMYAFCHTPFIVSFVQMSIHASKLSAHLCVHPSIHAHAFICLSFIHSYVTLLLIHHS